MDKLTAIKIKYDDGTYSDEIPVSVLSENVEWDSTHTLVDVLGNVDVSAKGTIQDQISQLFNEKANSSEYNNLVNKVDNLFNEKVSTSEYNTLVNKVNEKVNTSEYNTLVNKVNEKVNTSEYNTLVKEVSQLSNEKANSSEVTTLETRIDNLILSSEYVTPEMYGAKGDGITDDTLAIQNALDNNKEVHLFPKTYKISSIVLHSYNVLQGCGQFSVLDTSITNGSDYVITTDNVAINVVIRDLKIKCNSNTNSGGGGNGIRMVVTDYSQISEQPDTHFLIDNVYIDHPNIGCKIDEHNGDSLINNLHIRHAYNYGLIVETGDCRFSNITIGWCNKEGIYALSTMCQWDNIKVFECGMKEQNGYAVQLGAWMTVTNLVIQGAYYNALLVKSYNSISGLYITQTNYITKSGVVNNNAHNINVNGVGNNISGTIQDGLGNVTSKYGVYASNFAMFYYETIIMSIYANNGSQIIGVASNLEALKPNSIQVTSNINSYNYVYDTAEKFNKNINQYRGYSVQKKIKIKWDSSKYINGDKIAVFIYGFNFGTFIVKIGTDTNSIAALRDIQTIISSSNQPTIDDYSTAGELLLSALSPWQEFAYLILLDTKGLATVEVVDAT